MLPNGPACTSAGWPSIVCTMFGLIASFMIDRHRAADLQVVRGHRLAVEGGGDDDAAEAPPQVLQVARRARATAITSDAAVMTNWFSRGMPCALPPSPVTA